MLMTKKSLNIAISLLVIGIVGVVLFFVKAKSSLSVPKTHVPKLAQNEAAEVYPTAIPWISSEQRCENSERQWQNEKCMDYEHSPYF